MRKLKCTGVVLKVIHDPNRTAKVGLVFYYNGLLSYIILSEGIVSGSVISSGSIVNALLDIVAMTAKKRKLALVVVLLN